MAAFGFFGAIVFLSQWFQVVRGIGATESGLNLLPLVFALIVGATLSGQIAARTIPNVVAGVYDAFAFAISSTFWVSIAAAIIAAVIVIFLRDPKRGERLPQA